MSAARHTTSGFTLTEVLVASTLLSIVMTAVYTLFFSVISTWRSEENDEGLHRRARSLLTILERDYANFHGGGSFLFEGTADEVTLFVVAQPLEVTSGEGRRLMRVRYRFDREAGTVTREEGLVEGMLPGTTAGAETLEGRRVEVSDETEFVLATGVAQFRLNYLWVQRPDSAYWQNRPVPVEPVSMDQHRTGWGLPQALEVNLTLVGSDPSQSPVEHSARYLTRGLNRQRDAWELSRMGEGTP
jgi:prepilin-type N-terminal cleavage/methylation domain-containing protein